VNYDGYVEGSQLRHVEVLPSPCNGLRGPSDGSPFLKERHRQLPRKCRLGKPNLPGRSDEVPEELPIVLLPLVRRAICPDQSLAIVRDQRDDDVLVGGSLLGKEGHYFVDAVPQSGCGKRVDDTLQHHRKIDSPAYLLRPADVAKGSNDCIALSRRELGGRTDLRCTDHQALIGGCRIRFLLEAVEAGMR